jgi:ABC-type transporter Mla subunit MlaD
MKPHYFKIGVFVILAMILIFIAAVFLGAGLFAQEKIYVETYFQEAVSGLNVGSPIELRGVKLGQVEKIGFVAKVYGDLVTTPDITKYGLCVVVVCSVSQENLQGLSIEQARNLITLMIANGLRFQVTSNILTGQSYLMGDYLDPEKYPALEIDWQPEHIYVPSAPSDMTTLRDSVSSVLDNLREIELEKLVASLDKAIVDANVGEISQQAIGLLSEVRLKVRALDTDTLCANANQILASLDQTVIDANVPELSQQLQGFIAELRYNLQKLLASQTATQSNIPEMIAQINSVLSRVDNLIANERPKLEIIMANLREISNNIRELSGSLKEHPSELLFSEPPSKSEALK